MLRSKPTRSSSAAPRRTANLIPFRSREDMARRRATVMVLAAALAVLLLAAAASTTATAARDGPAAAAVSSSSRDQASSAAVAEGKGCEGANDEDECMMRRTLAAHTDYIYTQEHHN